MASNQKFKGVMLGLDGSITQFADIPAASVDYRDSFAKVYGGAGVEDVVYACMKTEDDSYRWVAVVHSYNYKTIELPVFESDTDCATGDGKASITIPERFDGYEIFDVQAGGIHTLGVGSTMNIQLRRRREAADQDILSTLVTVAPAEYTANDGVVNATHKDLVEGDNLYVDIDQVHTTPAKGLTVVIVIRK